jgi:hypothetical protein
MFWPKLSDCWNMEATINKELKPYYNEDIGEKQIYGLPKIRSPVNVLYPNNQLFYPELKPNLNFYC